MWETGKEEMTLPGTLSSETRENPQKQGEQVEEKLLRQKVRTMSEEVFSG